jgi:diaminopimelate epimerase
MTSIPFTKMVASGNDFIVVDTIRNQFTHLGAQWSRVSKMLCDRHRGIGADGLLVLEPSKAACAKMRIFNPDGSEAAMCGNGARCAALYLASDDGAKANAAAHVTIQAKAGVLSAEVRGAQVALRMTDPTDLRLGLTLSVDRKRVQFGYVNTGVAHVVVPVAKLDDVDVNRLGRALRYHRRFSPEGANVNFIQADSKHPSRLRVRTYERGVEGETLACGTGVAASAVVYAMTENGQASPPAFAGGHGLCPWGNSKQNTLLRRGVAPKGRSEWCNGHGRGAPHRIEVDTNSGERLSVSFLAAKVGSKWRVSNVILNGPARQICRGTARWPLF